VVCIIIIFEEMRGGNLVISI